MSAKRLMFITISLLSENIERWTVLSFSNVMFSKYNDFKLHYASVITLNKHLLNIHRIESKIYFSDMILYYYIFTYFYYYLFKIKKLIINETNAKTSFLEEPWTIFLCFRQHEIFSRYLKGSKSTINKFKWGDIFCAFYVRSKYAMNIAHSLEEKWRWRLFRKNRKYLSRCFESVFDFRVSLLPQLRVLRKVTNVARQSEDRRQIWKSVQKFFISEVSDVLFQNYHYRFLCVPYWRKGRLWVTLVAWIPTRKTMSTWLTKVNIICNYPNQYRRLYDSISVNFLVKYAAPNYWT